MWLRLKAGCSVMGASAFVLGQAAFRDAQQIYPAAKPKRVQTRAVRIGGCVRGRFALRKSMRGAWRVISAPAHPFCRLIVSEPDSAVFLSPILALMQRFLWRAF